MFSAPIAPAKRHDRLDSADEPDRPHSEPAIAASCQCRSGHVRWRPWHGLLRAHGETTGSVPAAPPPPTWTWEGGTPIVVAPGETLESISRRHGVPVAAIMQANNIVIRPRYIQASTWYPQASVIRAAYEFGDAAGWSGRCAAYRACPNRRRSRGGAGRDTSQHLQLYGKPVMVLAKANNIPPDTMVKVGERIVIRMFRSGRAAFSRHAPKRQPLRPLDPITPVRNRHTAPAWQCLSRLPPPSRLRPSKPPNRPAHCRVSAGRRAAASSPASVRRRTACRMTVSISLCPKARRSSRGRWRCRLCRQ